MPNHHRASVRALDGYGATDDGPTERGLQATGSGGNPGFRGVARQGSTEVTSIGPLQVSPWLATNHRYRDDGSIRSVMTPPSRFELLEIRSVSSRQSLSNRHYTCFCDRDLEAIIGHMSHM